MEWVREPERDLFSALPNFLFFLCVEMTVWTINNCLHQVGFLMRDFSTSSDDNDSIQNHNMNPTTKNSSAHKLADLVLII